MIRPKQSEVKSVPDNEVMLTFWGGTWMFRQNTIPQGKCKNIKALFYKAAEVAIFSIDYPPDKAGTELPPEDPLTGHLTSFCCILMQFL